MAHAPPSPAPEWCRPPPELVGRMAVIAAARAALEDGPVTLAGPAGAGATTAGAALVQLLVAEGVARRGVFVRAHACTTSSDVLLAIGEQLDLPLPGDAAVVRAALAEAPTAILVDDADLCPSAVRTAADADPHALWVLTGRGPAVGATVQVPPLADHELRALLPAGVSPTPFGGLPVLTALPLRPDAGDPWRALDGIPVGGELLAGVPMGLRDPPVDIPSAFLRGVPGRAVPRRAVAEGLGVGGRPTAEVLQAVLRSQGPHLEQLAVGVGDGTSDDLALYREGAAVLRDDDLATLCGAAAARLALRLGQPAEAIRIASGCAAAHPDASPIARALLYAAEGDVHLTQGDVDEAEHRHLSAADLLRGRDEIDHLSALCRRVATLLARRGDADAARRWLATARECTDPADNLAEADILRISGDLAAHAGELVGAEALYEHGEATLRDVPGSAELKCAFLIARAALATARGQLGPAEALLHDAAQLDLREPLTDAAIALRRGEVAVRRGRTSAGARHAVDALRGYARAGRVDGVALAWLLTGDVRALRGDRAAASRAYRRALALCTRTRSARAARRALRRLLAVENEGLPGPHVEELREILDIAEVLEHVDGDGPRTGRVV